MAKSSKKTGGGEATAPPPAADDPPAADSPATMQAAAAARPEIATEANKAASSYMAPPQGPGAPARLRYDGSPHAEARLNTAMKALLDPAARTSWSRVYSGQTRNWGR
jgi:hypothetical protein